MTRATCDLGFPGMDKLTMVTVDGAGEGPHPDNQIAAVELPGRAIGSKAFQQLVLRQFYRDAPGSRLLLSVHLTQFCDAEPQRQSG